ncbi:thiolase family protein [Sphingobium yanoikuyae]|jgi:acetyl-CoA acetyltransferase|uniref:Thiolase family protein n=1 Tax=Sphingobium yanoikuyae TaxID=13690 RepID=A0A085JZA8_SPHYA|nr:thiolase family protein [Sphingobium yanoikuyae]AYO79445.1 thiolase family protein [Sphingobium yanoikuyae]KFD25804.1 diterpenoid dioxygenase [Sphingobium yanoikuyae]KZC75356.1 dioxygenase [Sphingobium yanoikuyae]MDV3481034.1 thiolase family protein [Sphingobium yanoikuyae]
MNMAREAYITGIGMSEVGVRLTRSPLGLTLDAVREAIADAGLTLDQIDGVATYPGKMSTFLGFSPVSSDDVIEILGLNTRWHIGAAEATAQLGAIAEAAMAVKAGLARHVLCFRTVYEAAALARPDEFPPMERRKDVSGNSQWVSPFGAFSAANWTAQFAMRHMKRYGLTREQLAQVALNDHANAARNPRAIVRKPLTMDEYMAARMISSPFCLYDCDRFTDASTVLIVSAGDALGEVKTTPIRIAASAGSVERYSWDQAEWASAYPTGRDLWKNTDYSAKDVDTVQFYDGFAFQPITWLEGLGFCDVGEGGQFLEGGKRIALDGELPMNTGGGQLGWGRLHGFGFAYESVVQLRGEGGERQIAGDPKVAVATSGGGPMAAALLLAKD